MADTNLQSFFMWQLMQNKESKETKNPTETKENTLEVNKEIFNNAKKKMLQHFVGIDSVINAIFNQIETWFLYPEFLTRPTIINLWGLTGVGKTDFVKKLVKYLGLPNKFCTINLSGDTPELHDDYGSGGSGVYTGLSNNVLEALTYNNIRPKDKSILLLDEIHQFRTIDNKGKEWYGSGKYRDIWNLLSDGSVYNNSQIVLYIQGKILSLRKRLQQAQNNDLKNSENISNKFLINFGIPVYEEKEKVLKSQDPSVTQEQKEFYERMEKQNRKNETSELEKFFKESWNPLNSRFLANMITITPEDINYINMLRMQYQDYTSVLFDTMQINKNNYNIEQLFERCSCKVMLEFLQRKHEELSNKNINLDFEEERYEEDNYIYSKMLIFICGNLKEEIYMKHDTLSTNDIIEFLSDRFPPEHIARFGHNYIMYPILTEQNFEKIIEREIDIQEKKLQERFKDDTLILDRNDIKNKIKQHGYNIKQGTRPILSLVGLILSEIIPELLVKKLSYKDNITTEKE